MTCRVCKFFEFNQNDMMGACKLYPTVVNKLPQDWCGQEIPVKYEADWEKVDSITITVAPETTYDIHTDEVKPKRGIKNADKGTSK
jgi:hypothetical protein